MRDRRMRKAKEITFTQLLNTYEGIAAAERVRMGKPSVRRVSSAISGVGCILRECNISMNANITAMTRRKFDEYAVKAMGRDVSAVSVKAYFESFHALTAKWTSAYYKERKMQVPKFDIPRVFVPPKRYNRPSEETTARVVSWYKSLERKKDITKWGIVAMMLNFAMRNGDVVALTWGNFKKHGADIMLEYTPHKTSKSSGRRVVCRIAPKIWRRLVRLRGRNATDNTPVFNHTKWNMVNYFNEIGKDMRRFGFDGSKSSYELRKLCVDNVYRHFGAEAASAISGDDIRTVMKYYADSGIVNIGNVCVSDLMTRKA